MPETGRIGQHPNGQQSYNAPKREMTRNMTIPSNHVPGLASKASFVRPRATSLNSNGGGSSNDVTPVSKYHQQNQQLFQDDEVRYVATPQLFRQQSPRPSRTLHQTQSDEGPPRSTPDSHAQFSSTSRSLESPSPDKHFATSHDKRFQTSPNQQVQMSADTQFTFQGRVSGASAASSSNSSKQPTEKTYREKIMKLEEQLRRAILGHDKALQEKRKSEQHRQSLLYQLDGEAQKRQDVETELEELMKSHNEQIGILKEKYARKGSRIEQTFQNHQMLSERYDQLTREKGNLLDKLAKQSRMSRSLHQFLRSYIDRSSKDFLLLVFQEWRYISSRNKLLSRLTDTFNYRRQDGEKKHAFRMWMVSVQITKVESLADNLAHQVYERQQEIVALQQDLAAVQDEFVMKESNFHQELDALRADNVHHCDTISYYENSVPNLVSKLDQTFGMYRLAKLFHSWRTITTSERLSYNHLVLTAQAEHTDCKRYTLSRFFSAWKSSTQLSAHVGNCKRNVFMARVFKSWAQIAHVRKQNKKIALEKVAHVLRAALKRAVKKELFTKPLVVRSPNSHRLRYSVNNDPMAQEARRSALATSLPMLNGIDQLKNVLERPLRDAFRQLQVIPLEMESTILHEEVVNQQSIQSDLVAMRDQHDQFVYQMEQLRLQRDELRVDRDAKILEKNDIQKRFEHAESRIKALHGDLLTSEAVQAEVTLEREGLARRCEQDRLLLEKVSKECDVKVSAFEEQLASFAQKCGSLHHQALEARLSEENAKRKLEEYENELSAVRESFSHVAEDEAAKMSQKLHQANVRATVAQKEADEASTRATYF